MGILEDINNMKNQGVQDSEISRRLQEKGNSPRAIEDAFNQMRIKNAISAEYSGEEGMERSIMKADPEYETAPAPQTPPSREPAFSAASSALYSPKTQEIEHDSGEFYYPQPTPQQSQAYQTPQFNEDIQTPAYDNYNQEEYVPQEGYADNSAMGGGGAYDTDMIIEVAEQVFSEKIKKEQKQIESLNEFATLVEARITNDHERIKRVEEIIDKLQISILDKIGSYGKNLESIKNEMGMMQESFEKMVPVLHEKETQEKKTSKARR
jgi:hypothetical protein